MSKLILSLDEDYDFNLIGISCHAKDYRLCWELNQALGIELVRVDDYEITKKKEVSNYAFYEFLDNINYLDFYLIANKGSKGNLIPEHKTTDFFLMLKGHSSDGQLTDFTIKINELSLVLAAFKVDPESLKSKQNLLF